MRAQNGSTRLRAKALRELARSGLQGEALTGGKGSLSMRRAICCACCCTRNCCCGVRLASAFIGSADRAFSGRTFCASDADRPSVCRTCAYGRCCV